MPLIVSKKISILIPAFNEGETVGAVIERLQKVSFNGWLVEIIAINDGSTDNTRAVLDKHKDRVKVIHLEKNVGKGGAVRAGIDVATGDFALIQDADLECAPEEIPNLLDKLDKHMGEKVMVMGSRELGYDSHKSELFSRAGSLLITKIINILYRVKLTDTLMGYKLFPKDTFSYFTGGGFDSEMLFLCRLLEEGYIVLEVPVSYNPRDKSEGKKINYFHGLKIIQKIVGFWFRGLFRKVFKTNKNEG